MNWITIGTLIIAQQRKDDQDILAAEYEEYLEQAWQDANDDYYSWLDQREEPDYE